ncbi:hypothetical protein [Streptomyces boncukensis]|uniref:Uncharacterized protein n=1 Tax=Streptomyces boncukensis TaxID=2711219 RepID=A0A6G4WS54_9ACTN|nr:hypothetical protein [Streptomyces boncukensis]NGO67470.1 hypothetical protein [Streptomyces boncukensis]
MNISVSLVLILGVAVVAAFKLRSLTGGGFILAALFGFYLASTDMAPSINQFMAALSNTFSGIGN